MSFTSLTDDDRAAMLAAIGVDSVADLFSEIPADVRLDRPLRIDRALTEGELWAHLCELAGRNSGTGSELSFLGAGMYDHYVPAVVDAVMQRGELLTAYTPVPAGDEPGHAAGDLRVPDRDLRADRDGRVQRVRLRRDDRRRRRVLRREADDGPRRGSSSPRR